MIYYIPNQSIQIVYFPHQRVNAADTGVLCRWAAVLCQGHTADKVLKKTYMINLFSFMNNTVTEHNHT